MCWGGAITNGANRPGTATVTAWVGSRPPKGWWNTLWPRVTGTAEPWASEVKQALSGRTEELERLVVEMYARGLSMRDIEAAFTGADGRCVLSKSAASQVAERLWEDY